ncbi:SEC14 cytosolic factor family protein / phosphoglyceride transfer family protein [Theobroma cacao]|uniref:SEC14 cytosolic factor family protein / phosphoglyceride transfer family protein n=1 Tax=Theobroma cacao TaxID=3641 RepID=A0A061DQ29_THECC|nr:SEC14 cytosolic factor family protein / phosphoglyceride transfer family protein [Theobroma cacao]
MADEVQNTASDVVPQVDEVVVVPDVPQAEKSPAAAAVGKEPPPVPESDEEPVKPKQVEEALETEVSKPDVDDQEKVPQSGSFKEESSRVADLLENEKKALEELKQLVQEALNKHESGGLAMPQQPEAAKEDEKKELVVTENEKKEVVVTEDEKEPAKEEPKDEVVTDEPPIPKTETETETETVAEAKKEPEKEETINLLETEGIEEKVAATAVSDTVEDDGAKTVEAIEETIVSVSSSVQPEQPAAAKEPAEADVVLEETQEDAKTEDQVPPEDMSIWGIPLLADERSDVILLKFLRARDFKVKDAFAMLKNTIRWRKEFGIDELIEQDLGDDLEKVVFMHGFDKEGHPVCYNVYGEFQNKELYQKTFSDEEKRQKFLRWRIQFLEKSIRILDFRPGGICTIVQVNDLKNSPGPAKWELRQATKQALQLLQDNYPEFVARQVFINVPWWYLAVNRMISPFLTQRTRSKFVFAGPSKSAETLFRYIAAEQVPVKYGGLSKDGEFANTDAVTEITVKPSAKHTVEFPVTETCLLTWEVRVVGWDVSYGAEFVPSAEDSYTVIIQKARKVASTEEPVVCNNFKIGEPGKVILTIDNPTSKKKKLLYRLKTKPTSD